MAEVRLIDANALFEAVKKWLPQDPCGREEKEIPFETDICVSMLMEIEEAPTIEAEPVRHGHWIDHPSTISIWRGYECSECKGIVSGGSPDYCPNCGAKMDAKENANDGETEPADCRVGGRDCGLDSAGCGAGYE